MERGDPQKEASIKNILFAFSRIVVVDSDPVRSVSFFMYRRPILCTFYGAVDFLNVLKKYIIYL